MKDIILQRINESGSGIKNAKQIRNEIEKLRKLSKSKYANVTEQDRAWSCMLTLQWIFTEKNFPITPIEICKPNIQKWILK